MVREDCEEVDCANFTAGATAVVRAYYEPGGDRSDSVKWGPAPDARSPAEDTQHEAHVSTAGLNGPVQITATLHDNPDVTATSYQCDGRPVQPISGTVGVNLRRSAVPPTRDQALWVAIRDRTRAISFSGTGVPGTGYRDFINRVLCNQEPLDPR